jgi:hypothetical protein
MMIALVCTVQSTLTEPWGTVIALATGGGGHFPPPPPLPLFSPVYSIGDSLPGLAGRGGQWPLPR